MNEFEVKILETNAASKKDAAMLKDTTGAVKLGDKINEIAKTGPAELPIDVVAYAVIETHNEKAKTKDYTSLVMIDRNGVKYSTSSEAFLTTFKQVFKDVLDIREEGEEAAIKVVGIPSKNNGGNLFLTCTVI